MTDDPTLQEIVRRGPSQFLTPWQKAERWALRIGLVGLIVVAVWVYTVHATSSQAKSDSSQAQAASAKAQQAADAAAKNAQGSCQWFHDIGSTPPASTTGILGLTILKDARIAYQDQGCPLITGPLPAPDPRIKAILPPGVR